MQVTLLYTDEIALRVMRPDSREVCTLRPDIKTRIVVFYTITDDDLTIQRIEAGHDCYLYDVEASRKMIIRTGTDLTTDFTPHQIREFEDQITKQLKEAA